MEFVAVNDAFGASGAIAELMARYGLTASNVISSARTVLARKG
jgi:transketolase C-terminal domain/subunit